MQPKLGVVWEVFSGHLLSSETQIWRENGKTCAPMALESCYITWNASLGVEQSQEFQWLQETEVNKLPWQQGWLVRANSTLEGWRKRVQIRNSLLVCLFPSSLIIYITHFLTFLCLCFGSNYNFLLGQHCKNRIPFVYWTADNKLDFHPFLIFPA